METDDLTANAILANLPEPELEQLRARCTIVDLETRATVYDSGSPIPDVYFPLDSVFSMVTTVDGDVSIEVGTIGFEGMVGLPAFLGSASSPHTAYNQVPGTAARVSVPALREVLADDGALHSELHRYTSATMVQLAQNVACNSSHHAEQRASRWLLTTHDRVRRATFPLTQEFFAQMLGLRRPTVSDIAQRLQDRGLIEYVRGRMTVLDRAGLERVTCECYWTVRQAFPGIDRARADPPTGRSSDAGPGDGR